MKRTLLVLGALLVFSLPLGSSLASESDAELEGLDPVDSR